MVFSDTSTRQGLYEDAQDRVQQDTNGFPITMFTRWCNIWYRRAAVAIWKNSDGWRYDDTTNIAGSDTDDDAGLPVVTSSLSNSTRTYSLPTDALQIRRVEVKDQAGIWKIVNPIREEDITVAKEEYQKTDGRPIEYLLMGTKLQLFPAPDNGISVTLTNGLRIFTNRDVSIFATTDTTKVPSLPIPWHQLLSIGPAYDYAAANGLSNKDDLKAELVQQYPEMTEFVSGRQLDGHSKLRLRPRVPNFM